MSKSLGHLLFCAAALLAAGCQTSNIDTGAYPPKNTNKYDLENRANFVLLDRATQTSVTCHGIQERRLDDGRLQVSANVRNRLHRRIQVQINCVFKDAQGFVVEDTPWRDLILDENAQEGVSFVSTQTTAQKYTIRVRQAR
ncbi:MAG: YcfL family protein [Verrucomicrobiae bacterium]|nr:YcfL family protein [Verrucomicrobiae bacterium]